jgi:hypothetical protein
MSRDLMATRRRPTVWISSVWLLSLALESGSARASVLSFCLFPGTNQQVCNSAESGNTITTVGSIDIPGVPGATFQGSVKINGGKNKLTITITGDPLLPATITSGDQEAKALAKGIAFVSAFYDFDAGAGTLSTGFNGSLVNLQGGNLPFGQYLQTVASATTFTATDFGAGGNDEACAVYEPGGGTPSPNPVVGQKCSVLFDDRVRRGLYAAGIGELTGTIFLKMGPHEQFQFPNSIDFGAEVSEPPTYFLFAGALIGLLTSRHARGGRRRSNPEVHQPSNGCADCFHARPPWRCRQSMEWSTRRS